MPAASIQPRWRSTAAVSASSPAARVARTVERIPPPAAWSSSYVAPRGAQRELLDAVAREARVRVAVDEARDRAEAAPVELLDVAVERAEVAHPPGRRDPPVLAEDVGVLDDLDLAERRAAERCSRARRGGELREVADEQAARGVSGLRLLERAARVVHPGEADEQLVERLALFGIERGEELVLEPLDERAEPRQLALACRRDADDVAAAVLRVALPLDQAALLEPVEQCDQPAGSSPSASAIVAWVSRAPSARIASTL